MCRDKDCRGGTLFLGVDWQLVPEVVRRCCAYSWHITFPQELRAVVNIPSALAQLRRMAGRRRRRKKTTASCIKDGMIAAAANHEFQVRGVGANDAGSEFRLRLKVAQRGFPRAQLYVGVALQAGRGVEQNETKAADWFRHAAEQGEENSMLYLGEMLYDGSAVPQDLNKAAHWFRIAAEQGHGGAQMRLGMALMSGEGVAQNLEDGLWWLAQAAEQGDETARSYLEAQGVG